MIVTEEEAKTKWCPEARIPTDTVCGVPTAVNRDCNNVSNGHCIGSACMAWRWAWLEGAVGPAGEKPVHLCTDFGRTPLGYCGKAGRAT